VGDDAALHEVDEQRGKAGLDDVATEHDDDRAFFPDRDRYRFDHAPEVARDQNVGQRFEEIAEAAIRARRWRGSELSGGDLVGTPLDGNGADSGKICFRCPGSGALRFPRWTGGAGLSFTA